MAKDGEHKYSVVDMVKRFGTKRIFDALSKRRVGNKLKRDEIETGQKYFKFNKGGMRGSCWQGYQQKGMKKKGGKMVPNCVPAGMKSGGLTKWFQEKWVDIGSKKKGGGYKPCGRKSASGSKRKYPKCVPAAKAASMSESQKRSAVRRKRAAGNAGPKPTNVKTMKASVGGLADYYKGLL